VPAEQAEERGGALARGGGERQRQVVVENPIQGDGLFALDVLAGVNLGFSLCFHAFRDTLVSGLCRLDVGLVVKTELDAVVLRSFLFVDGHDGFSLNWPPRVLRDRRRYAGDYHWVPLQRKRSYPLVVIYCGKEPKNRRIRSRSDRWCAGVCFGS
jgi:hypothetical protein